VAGTARSPEQDTISTVEAWARSNLYTVALGFKPHIVLMQIAAVQRLPIELGAEATAYGMKAAASALRGRNAPVIGEMHWLLPDVAAREAAGARSIMGDSLSARGNIEGMLTESRRQGIREWSASGITYGDRVPFAGGYLGAKYRWTKDNNKRDLLKKDVRQWEKADQEAFRRYVRGVLRRTQANFHMYRKSDFARKASRSLAVRWLTMFSSETNALFNMAADQAWKARTGQISKAEAAANIIFTLGGNALITTLIRNTWRAITLGSLAVWMGYRDEDDDKNKMSPGKSLAIGTFKNLLGTGYGGDLAAGFFDTLHAAIDPQAPRAYRSEVSAAGNVMTTLADFGAKTLRLLKKDAADDPVQAEERAEKNWQAFQKSGIEAVGYMFGLPTSGAQKLYEAFANNVLPPPPKAPKPISKDPRTAEERKAASVRANALGRAAKAHQKQKIGDRDKIIANYNENRAAGEVALTAEEVAEAAESRYGEATAKNKLISDVYSFYRDYAMGSEPREYYTSKRKEFYERAIAEGWSREDARKMLDARRQSIITTSRNRLLHAIRNNDDAAAKVHGRALWRMGGDTWNALLDSDSKEITREVREALRTYYRATRPQAR